MQSGHTGLGRTEPSHEISVALQIRGGDNQTLTVINTRKGRKKILCNRCPSGKYRSYKSSSGVIVSKVAIEVDDRMLEKILPRWRYGSGRKRTETQDIELK